MRATSASFVTLVLLLSGVSAGQSASPQAMDPNMPGMDMSDTGHGMPMHGQLGRYGMSREASGTSWQPEASLHSAIHVMADDWMVMLHGRVSGIGDWQSGPRGGDQFFSTSMAMAM